MSRVAIDLRERCLHLLFMRIRYTYDSQRTAQFETVAGRWWDTSHLSTGVRISFVMLTARPIGHQIPKCKKGTLLTGFQISIMHDNIV